MNRYDMSPLNGFVRVEESLVGYWVKVDDVAELLRALLDENDSTVTQRLVEQAYVSLTGRQP